LTIKQLQRMQHELAEAVREYSRSQAELWKQLPWWTLQAQGRVSGWGPGYEYSFGIHILESLDTHGHHIGGVDLETGEIIYIPDSSTNIRPITDDTQILEIDLEELEAEPVLAMHKEEAGQRTASYYNYEDQEDRRQELARRYGLSEGEPYKRIKPFKVAEDYMG